MMKLVSSALMLLVLGLAIFGQEVKPEATPTPPGGGNLLQQLGLSPDQMLRIRQLNKQRKPAMEEAQLRVREANRVLDAAIYADTVDDSQVAARLEELQKAQADVARIRFTNELAIRRILTPDQLSRFRELRRQVAATLVERRQDRIADGTGGGLRRGRALPRQNRPADKPPSPTPAPHQAQPKP